MKYKALRDRRLREQEAEVAEQLRAQRAFKLQGDLAQLFYDRRMQLGYTQAEAASRCGITQARVSIIEGSGAHPTPALLEKLARGLQAAITVVYHRERDHEISLVPEAPGSWEETKRKVRERRIAAGLPVRTAEEKQAAMARLAAEVRAYQLAEVRRDQALTQRDVAGVMGVSAPRVSAIEHGEVDRTEVATLRSYVEALGGRLKVVADFGDTEYTVA